MRYPPARAVVYYTCNGALKARVVITRHFVTDVILAVVSVLILSIRSPHQGPVQGVRVRPGLLLVRKRTGGRATGAGAED